MIIIQFPVNQQAEVMRIIGSVEAEDIFLTVKVRGDVGEGVIQQLEKLKITVIKPLKP